MLVASAVELREALRLAAPGAVLDLAPGEYGGPFLIEIPITLRGQDRRTVLWRRGGPVLFIRAPGVRLERLLIERTVDKRGPTVVHAHDCLPTGKESMELEGDSLISLGELAPGASLSLPLEVETSARAEIAVTGLYGAQVTPARLDDAGKYLVQLMLDGKALLRGEILLGEIAIRLHGAEGEPDSTRYIWISGTVRESALPTRQFCLATKKNRAYPSATGLMLDGPQLAALENADPSLGRFAFIQRDPGGSLFLYQMGHPPAPVMLNGTPVVRGSRTLLKENDLIKAGDVTLTVQPSEPLPITLEPARATFAEFGAQFPDAVELTLTTGKSGWRGQLLPGVPWLSVAPEGVFRVPPSRSHIWTVTLNEAALALPNGRYEVTGGLLVAGSNQVLSLDVHLNVERPDVALRIKPLDAEAVEWGWPVERTLELDVENLGRGAWIGTIRSNVPWLEILSPQPVEGGPWSETPVQIGFVQAWDILKTGVHDVPDALTVTAQDGEHAVSVLLEVMPAQGHLGILTPLVTFKDVERGAPSLPHSSLELRNEGGGLWTGRLRAVNSWVRLDPAEVTLAPGATAQIAVELADIPPEQALDTPEIIDEIEFESRELSVPVEETVQVQLTLIELPPFLVARPVVFPPLVKGDPPLDGVLAIHNMGPAAWQGTVVANLPLLSAPDRVLTCPPGETINVPISLTGQAVEELAVGAVRWENALAVTGGREPVSTSVQVDVREVTLELHLETPTLNFGQVNGAIADMPADTVRVLNAGPVSWTGRVEIVVPWLSAESESRAFDLEIPRMSVAEFRVQLNESARLIPPGVIQEERAIVIRSRDPQPSRGGPPLQEMVVRALLVASEWAPRLEIRPEKIVLSGAEPQTLRLRNVGTRSWSLQISPVSWLSIAPVDIVLKSGVEQAVEIRHKASVRDSATILDDPRAIVIVGSGWEREIGVEVRLPKAVSAPESLSQPAAPSPAATQLPSQPAAPQAATLPPVPPAATVPADKDKRDGPPKPDHPVNGGSGGAAP